MTGRQKAVPRWELEATGGFEPPIEVLQTPALTTWLRRPACGGAPGALQIYSNTAGPAMQALGRTATAPVLPTGS